ncbi:MAG: hypothetical protein H6765_04835 [Candidatus Peribacteria bacterium]|nr:MAG: hypothetical protein H6765_04835 [Candidatus Peribacteria bacterium]
MAVYVNGKRLTTDDILRLGTQEAKNGIYIDGTATVPIGQRTIISHKWQIQGKQSQQFDFTKSGDGPPGQYLLRFPENGVYSVKLDIEDNE